MSIRKILCYVERNIFCNGYKKKKNVQRKKQSVMWPVVVVKSSVSRPFDRFKSPNAICTGLRSGPDRGIRILQ